MLYSVIKIFEKLISDFDTKNKVAFVCLKNNFIHIPSSEYNKEQMIR